MKRKAVEARLALRIKMFEEGGRSGGNSKRGNKVAANGFDMHKPGSYKKG